MKEEITILVVDSEPMMRNLLRKILSNQGYQVLPAENGPSALEILKDRQVSIVISDTALEGSSGFDLLQAIKRDYADVAVILMIAGGDTYAVKDALLLGADEYITKPFKSFEIAMVVERAYWRQLSRRQSASADSA